MFIFGEDVAGVTKIRNELKEGKTGYVGTRLSKVFNSIKNGVFGDCTIIHDMIDSVSTGGDFYITCFDFYSYLEAQQRADETYRNYRKWTEMAINGVASAGFFSSDRTIAEYCEDIWDI
jgi:starch phosphorylase